MKKMFLIVAIPLVMLAQSVIDGIAMKVNDEMITLFEIYKTQKSLNITQDEAIELLIAQKLESEELKRLDIRVDGFEVQEEMGKIAKENNMRFYEFRTAIRERYGSVEKYEDELKEKLKREKLIKAIIEEKARGIQESELREFYNQNIDQFSVAKSAMTVKHFSKNRESLEAMIKNPFFKFKDIESEDEIIDLTKANPRLSALVNTTKAGFFTPIISVGDQFVSFYVKEKSGMMQIPFEETKNTIFGKLAAQKEKDILKEHQIKLRAEARVTVVRLP